MSLAAQDVRQRHSRAGGHALSALAVRSWSQGGYSYPGLGSTSEDREDHARPLGNRVFFAGEATEPVEYGTVHAGVMVRRADRRGAVPGGDRRGGLAEMRPWAGRGAVPAVIMVDPEMLKHHPRQQDLLRAGDRVGPVDARRAVRRPDQHGRGPTDSPERARGSNKLMWWRVRLQLLTLVFILLWWMTKG